MNLDISVLFTRAEKISLLERIGYKVYTVEVFDEDPLEGPVPTRLTLASLSYTQEEMEKKAFQEPKHRLLEEFSVESVFGRVVKEFLLELIMIS